MSAALADAPSGVLEDGDGQFVLRIGGQAPTTHTVKLYGGAIEVEPPEGGFVKGKAYRLEIDTVCHRVQVVDEFDGKTGDVIGARDERGLKITGASFVEVLES
jgi:hypothetical protein